MPLAAGQGVQHMENLLAESGELAFAEIAEPAPRPVGAPRYSDVIVSSRWPRPRDASDPDETFEATEAFLTLFEVHNILLV